MGRKKKMANEIIKERLDIGTLFQKEPGGLFYLRSLVSRKKQKQEVKTT